MLNRYPATCQTLFKQRNPFHLLFVLVTYMCVYAVLEMNCACVSIICPHYLTWPAFSSFRAPPSSPALLLPYSRFLFHLMFMCSLARLSAREFLMVRSEAGTLAPLVDHPFLLVTLETPPLLFNASCHMEVVCSGLCVLRTQWLMPLCSTIFFNWGCGWLRGTKGRQPRLIPAHPLSEAWLSISLIQVISVLGLLPFPHCD